jgi:hypothetical protein
MVFSVDDRVNQTRQVRSARTGPAPRRPFLPALTRIAKLHHGANCVARNTTHPKQDNSYTVERCRLTRAHEIAV